MARVDGAGASSFYVSDELSDPGYILGRTTDAAQSSGPLRAQSPWIHIAFLFAVTLTPFSTTLLAEFPEYRIALVAYWLNILLLGIALYVSWVCATRTGLLKNDIPPEISSAIKRRIVVAQACYALGALLCVFNTYWSIGFIVLVQLNNVIAPRFMRRLES
jgi:uncharacterized membrane protein